MTTYVARERMVASLRNGSLEGLVACMTGLCERAEAADMTVDWSTLKVDYVHYDESSFAASRVLTYLQIQVDAIAIREREEGR